MREEAVAKICSKCKHFEDLGYRCPHIEEVIKINNQVNSICSENNTFPSRIFVLVGCMEFDESHKKHSI